MSRHSCPRDSETLTAYRRGRVDPSIESHVVSCVECGQAMAADRALALLAAAGDSRPFPSAAVLRLEGELRLEEQRLARRAHIVIGLHAGALALSLALLAAVRFGEVALDARGAMFGSAGSICAIVVVVISIWNLAKSVGETALS